MKKTLICCLVFLAMGGQNEGFAQSTTAANTPGAGRFLGWTGGTAQSLEIRNNAAQAIYFQNVGNSSLRNRMLIDDASTGRIGLGNNLSTGFTPQERLHLHHSSVAGSEVYLRFTNNDTDSLSEDGANVGITQTELRITQYEDDYISFQTPKNLVTTGPTVQNRLRLASNGQFLVGTASITDENIIDEDAISSFTNAYRSSLLNVRGPIHSCFPLVDTHSVILYGYTNPNTPTTTGEGGFRMKMNFNYFDNNDALIFEKTDGNGTTVAGGFAFTTSGTDGVELPAFYIRGGGRTYVGRNLITSESSLLNRFVIDSEASDATESGLRFVDLTDSDTPITNTGPGVLAVDADGNVVYVESHGYADCGDTENGILSADSKIDLNDNNFYFTNQGDIDENMVIVGYDCGATLAFPAKLTVYENIGTDVAKGTIAGSFLNKDIAAEASRTFKGVYGESSGTQDQSGTINIGGDFKASGATINYGIFATATIAGTNRAGYFSGDVNYTGTLTNVSDKKFKQNIAKEESALQLLGRLKPVTYDLKAKEFSQFNLSDKKQHGFIAQELEAVLPELVHETYHPETLDEKGNVVSEGVSYKSVNYTGLISINTQAINELNQKVEEKDAIIKEQEKKIEDMNARLSQLENCLSALLPALCQMNQSAIEQNTPESQQALKQQLQTILSDRNSVVLTQNVPNPFAEATVIEYNIPATVAQAQIHFYDAQGKLIQSVDISTRGNGELKVFANDLSKGTYTYNLVADGKIVATKKMMKM
ncbi:MAG: hypothetical protein K0R65_2275 [Crocinitomicaceae bacterium]|jgi:hypothetical protein|nr:hypothetical protein [Crocinitomicaceae bacterium]